MFKKFLLRMRYGMLLKELTWYFEESHPLTIAEIRLIMILNNHNMSKEYGVDFNELCQNAPISDIEMAIKIYEIIEKGRNYLVRAKDTAYKLEKKKIIGIEQEEKSNVILIQRALELSMILFGLTINMKHYSSVKQLLSKFNIPQDTYIKAIDSVKEICGEQFKICEFEGVNFIGLSMHVPLFQKPDSMIEKEIFSEQRREKNNIDNHKFKNLISKAINSLGDNHYCDVEVDADQFCIDVTSIIVKNIIASFGTDIKIANDDDIFTAGVFVFTVSDYISQFMQTSFEIVSSMSIIDLFRGTKIPVEISKYIILISETYNEAAMQTKTISVIGNALDRWIEEPSSQNFERLVELGHS